MVGMASVNLAQLKFAKWAKFTEVSWPAPFNLADDGAWCLAGAIPGVRLIVKLWLLLWTSSCGTDGADIDRLLELVGWHCGAATQHAGVDHRALCMHRATATPASECTFHRNCVCPSVPTQNGRDRLAGPLNQGRQRKMHVLENCIRRLAYAAMWCMYAIRYVGRTRITRNFWPLILRY